MAKRNSGEDMPDWTPGQQYNLVCSPQLQRIDQAMRDNSEAIKEHTKEIRDMSKKVFNGYGKTIAAVEAKLDTEIANNAKSHEEIKGYLGSIVKFGATSLILIFVALLGVLGSVWFAGDDSPSQQREPQVETQIDIDRDIPESAAGEGNGETDDATDTGR